MENQNVRPTTVNEYMLWLENTVSADTALYHAAHEYLESERRASPDTEKRPFLSVITRTQGKRREMLTETLLCLTGQSDTDFELLIMGHNLNEEQDRTVRGLLDELPDWMREKTRLIPVTGGTRTTPLNEGFSAARGEYIAILDDDDLVFDNWVEEFHRLAGEQPGRVLHAYCILQTWETVGKQPDDCPRAAGSPENVFCRKFEPLSQVTLNTCPLMSLAFPADSFRKLGIHFDESLTTTEDWDFLMRTAFLAGVTDSESPTCLYRIWKNTENSQTLHNKEEWFNNYCKIIEKFRKVPLVLPSGTLDESFDRAVNARKELEDQNEKFNGTAVRLYYDTGAGMSEVCSIVGDYLPSKKGPSAVVFRELEDLGEIQTIRFDPGEERLVTVRDLKITVRFADGGQLERTMKDVIYNGYRYQDGIVFLKADPQIVCAFPEAKPVAEISVSYSFEATVDDSTVDALVTGSPAAEPMTGKKRSVFYRALRKLYHGFKKLFRRSK